MPIQIYWKFYHQKNENFQIKNSDFFHISAQNIQIYWKFYHQKTLNFQIKNSDVFHISAQNIDCGYSLESPRRDSSNEYLCFWVEK